MANVLQVPAKVVSDSASSAPITFTTNVAAGTLIVVLGALYGGSAIETLTAAQLTKTAGTATIGEITLDAVRQSFSADSAPDGFIAGGAWSMLVTGAGSLTLTFASSGSYYSTFAATELAGTWDSSRVNGSPAVNQTSVNNTTSIATGNVSTGGQGLIIGMMSAYTPANPFSMVVDGAFTSFAQEADFASHMGGDFVYQLASGALTDSVDWSGLTNNNEAVIALAVAYKEATTTVTGTGALTAQVAAVAGTAERSVKGTGALTAQVAAVAGTAERSVKGISTMAAQVAAIAGTALRARRVFRPATILAAQRSAIAGTGTVA